MRERRNQQPGVEGPPAGRGAEVPEIDLAGAGRPLELGVPPSARRRPGEPELADEPLRGGPRAGVLASIYFSPVSLNRRAVRAKAVSPVALTYFHRFRSRLDGAVPRQVLQPVGPAGYLDQVAVVAHPVRDRARRHVVPEHPAPAADPHVGGDDRRALLVARRYQLEQQVRARAADVEVAELVDDQQPRVGVVLEPLLEDTARRGVLQVLDEPGAVHEPDLAPRPDCLDAQRDGEVRLAHAGAPHEQDVLGPLDVDFAAMEAAAADAPENASAVIAVKRMRDFEHYGTVDVDAGGALTAFHEKCPCEEGLINAGVYLLRVDALDGMPEKFSLESDYFECVVGDGALRAVECADDFIDIGVPGDYELAQTMLAPLARSWRLAMFDRDGTINVDTGHLHEPEKLELIPSTVDIMRGYSEDPDFKVVVVTNQAGIAKGLYTEADMRRLHRFMEDELERLGVHVDAWYFCPHHPDYTGPCDCRKPAPGMLLAAMRDFDAKSSGCVMYGDMPTDETAARTAGINFIHV